MSGIAFFGCEDYEATASFYVSEVGAEVWLAQSACTVCKYDNFLFGFCESEASETCGVLTFVTADRAGVDEFYDRFEDRARGAPEVNEEYEIYQFFADDPDGRTMEFQTFLHDTDQI